MHKNQLSIFDSWFFIAQKEGYIEKIIKRLQSRQGQCQQPLTSRGGCSYKGATGYELQCTDASVSVYKPVSGPEAKKASCEKEGAA